MSHWKLTLLAVVTVAGLSGESFAWQREVRVRQLPPQRESPDTNGAIIFGQNPLLHVEIDDEAIEVMDLGEYWIGLSCDQLSDDLRSHLKIEEGQGLIVRDAHEGNAAAKAGLKAHDVIVKADGEPVSDVKQLIAAVQKAAPEELTLQIIREGKKQTVKVTPEKRPEEWRSTTVRILPDGRVTPLIERPWIAVQPGAVLQPVPQQAPSHITSFVWQTLPPGVSVTVKREGGKPAQITVKRGDDEWSVNEKEIGELPKDLQPHVKRMLGGPGQIMWNMQQFRNQIQDRPIIRQLPGQQKPPIYTPNPTRPRTLKPVQPRTTTEPAKPRDDSRDELLRELRKELRRLSEKLEDLEEE